MTTHPGYSDVLKWLKRALFIAMLAKERVSLEIAQQQAEKRTATPRVSWCTTIIGYCLEHAISEASREADNAVREFKEITKYLQEGH